MVIIETSIFTRQVQGLLSDDEYRELQSTLVVRPRAGALIVGSGGLRKIRWGQKGRGERDDLTPAQVKVLKQIVEQEYP